MARTRRKAHQSIPAIEWVAGGAGLAIVLATLGFIGFEAFGTEPAPPDLHVTISDSTARSRGHAVEVIVRNDGQRAAASVVVEGVSGGARAEAHLDYVAGMSESTATLVFPAAAEPASIDVHVIGYTTP